MRSLCRNVCGFFENHCRVFVIVVLLVMAMRSCNRVIGDVAQPGHGSSLETVLDFFFIVALGGWAAFATSSIPLRLAGWLGGMASILLVSLQSHALGNHIPVENCPEIRQTRWTIILGDVGFYAVSAAAVLLAFLLCKWLLQSFGIHLRSVSGNSSQAAGGASHHWRLTALDVLILAVVFAIVIVSLRYIEPYYGWLSDAPHAIAAHPGFACTLIAIGVTDAVTTTILALPAAWFFLGNGRVLRKTCLVLLGGCIYFLISMLLAWLYQTEIPIVDQLAEMARRAAVMTVLFALVRCCGYSLEHTPSLEKLPESGR